MKDSFLQELDHNLADGYLNQREYDQFKAAYLECDAQRQELVKKLESGAIDREHYMESYQTIMQKTRLIENRRAAIANSKMNDHRKKSERKRIMPLIIILVVVSVGFGAYKIWDYIYSHRSIADIPEPVQVDLEGKARSEAHVVYGADFGRPQYKLEMFYLAEYDIKGLVVGTKHMSDETAYDKSFPVDVSLSWGEFAAHRDAVDCTNGPRKLSCTYSTDKLAKYGANRSIMNQVSNNHLSPSSREIYDKIKRIRAGNYVEIKGYLVSVKVSTDRDSFEATSSLSRTDHMDGAFDRTNTGCEMIYVTSVEWLD